MAPPPPKRGGNCTDNGVTAFNNTAGREARRDVWRGVAALALGFVLVFGLLERSARSIVAKEEFDRPFWYAQAAERLQHERLDVLVVGSSRIAYAVTEDILTTEMSARLGRPATVIDLGLGYSTWAEHALGLQRLIDAAPDHLRGALVLIEAPAGRIPLGSWGQWYHPFSPGLLRMVMRREDLPPLWRSPDRFDRKTAATLDWFGAGSALLRHRHRLREHVTARLVERMQGGAPGGNTAAAAVGGTRAGTRTLRTIRLNLVLQGIGLGRTASPGEPAPTETLVATARRAGMVPVLLFVPEHPDRTDSGGYAEERHRPGRSRLGDVEMLSPPVHVTPDEFFDGVHMSPAASVRFTAALARLIKDRSLAPGARSLHP